MKLQENKECFFCDTTENLHRHHVFGGPNRKHSEEYGMVVYLCANHHNMSANGVHMNRKRDLLLKKYAQKVFEEEYGHDKFMEVFKRNYL